MADVYDTVLPLSRWLGEGEVAPTRALGLVATLGGTRVTIGTVAVGQVQAATLMFHSDTFGWTWARKPEQATHVRLRIGPVA